MASSRKYLASQHEVLQYLLGAPPRHLGKWDGVELVVPEGVDAPARVVYADGGDTEICRFLDLEQKAVALDGAVTDGRTLYLLRWGMRHIVLPDAHQAAEEIRHQEDELEKKLLRLRRPLSEIFEGSNDLVRRAEMSIAVGIDNALTAAYNLWRTLERMPSRTSTLSSLAVPAALERTQELWSELPSGKRGPKKQAGRFAAACLRARIEDPEHVAMIAALEPDCQFGAGSGYLRLSDADKLDEKRRQQVQKAAIQHWRVTISAIRSTAQEP